MRRGAPRRSSAWPPSFQRRLESSVRDSGAHTGRRGVPAVPAQAPSFQRRLESRQGMRVPLVWMRVEDVSVRRGAPRRSSAWPPSFQRRLESSVRDSGAHTGRRGVSAVPAQAPSFQRRLESRQGMRVPLVWMRVEDVSVRRGAPRRSSAWPPSFQRRLESSVRDSGAHTGRRGVSAVPAQAPSFVCCSCRSDRPI